ncbi:MAG: spore maturation protein [Bacilli bacterium]
MTYISNLIIPIMVLGVVYHGHIKKVNVYDVFVSGAKEGISIAISIFPYLLGMIFAINIFTNSHLLEYFFENILNAVFNVNIPSQVGLLAILRPISGSSSLVVFNNIMENFGPDSFYGYLSSVIQGSTETTLYVLTLYFGSVGITKIKHCFYTGILTDILAIILSIIFINFFF